MPGLAPWFPQTDVRRFYEPETPPPGGEPSNELGAWPVEHVSAAIAAFDRDAFPPLPDAPPILAQLMQNARLLIDGGETRLAMNLLRNALMRDSTHPEALRLMAECLKHGHRLEDAAKCARALCQVRPTEAGSWFLLGGILYDLERDEDARRCFEECLRLAKDECPFLFDVYKLLGNANVRSADFNAAEECYNRAFAVNPRSDALMVNYGTLEIQRDDLEAAVGRFREAVELNGRNDKAWVGLALVHRHKGDAALAWANLERAMELCPVNRTALRLALDWAGQESGQQGSFDAAIRFLQNYLAVESADAEMSFALAKIFAFDRRFRDARLEIERTLALEPLLPGAAELLVALEQSR